MDAATDETLVFHLAGEVFSQQYIEAFLQRQFQPFGRLLLVLRIDEELYAALEKWAADEFRSVNGQIEFIIYKMLKDARRLDKDLPLKPDTEEK